METKKKRATDCLTHLKFNDRHGSGVGVPFAVRGIAPTGIWYGGSGLSPSMAIRDMIAKANEDKAAAPFEITPSFVPGIQLSELHSSVTVSESGRWWVEITAAAKAGDGEIYVVVGPEHRDMVSQTPYSEVLGNLVHDCAFNAYDLNIVVDVDDDSVTDYLKKAIHAVANWINFKDSNSYQSFTII